MRMPTRGPRGRRDALQDLVRFRLNAQSALDELRPYGWDSADDLVVLFRVDMTRALDRFLSGQSSMTDLSDWAEALESRDDVGFEADVVIDVLFELANPLLFGEATIESATAQIGRLQSLTG